MSNWTGGYVADIAYTSGFYRELSPVFLDYAACLQHVRTPDFSRDFHYCELACGQGFGTSLLAAVYPQGTFTGIDFNPAHIAGAQSVAFEAALANVQFLEESFASACELSDDVLPPQDVVALHGTYTWITRENQEAVLRFLDRKLKPGGLVFISYNTMPGWLTMMPVQHLIREYAERHPDRSDRQVDAALAFVDKLGGAESRYFVANPDVGPRFKQTRNKDRTYLAHEYLHPSWHPMYHTEVVRDLAEVKLDFVGSAQLLDNFPALSVPDDIRKIQEEHPDPAFQELIRDFAVNQQFRRDIFVRGRRRATEIENKTALRNLSFVPLRTRDKINFTFQTALGEAEGQEELYAPIVDALMDGPKTMAELAQAARVDMPQTIQATAVLTANGQIHPVAGEVSPDAWSAARRLNKTVAERALLGDPYRYLASPLTANGIPASDIELAAFDVLHEQTIDEPQALAEAIWSRFQRVGRRIAKDGQPLKDDAANIAELRERSQVILDTRVPIWRMLKIL